MTLAWGYARPNQAVARQAKVLAMDEAWRIDNNMRPAPDLPSIGESPVHSSGAQYHGISAANWRRPPTPSPSREA